MNSTIGNRSIFERVFHLSERGTTLRTELIAGATTFLSCVSIMVLNPTILAAAGMDQKAVFWATALSSCIGCLWIGLWGNFPFALGHDTINSAKAAELLDVEKKTASRLLSKAEKVEVLISKGKTKDKVYMKK